MVGDRHMERLGLVYLGTASLKRYSRSVDRDLTIDLLYLLAVLCWIGAVSLGYLM